jgi:uncharacterized SAM-binding protein YcdF (DUF218 family)
MYERTIMVLGSPNASNGRLGPIAISRAQKCLEIFDKNTDKILCTGGFGLHFNTSQLAHSYYMQKYLEKQGLNTTCFLSPALSANTVEDASKARAILAQNQPKKLYIITSEYHMARVQLIFDEILQQYDKTYLATANTMGKKALQKLEAHEAKSIAEIISKGLYY